MLQIVTFKCERKFRKVSTRLMVSRNRFVIKRSNRSNGAWEVVIEWKSLEARQETIRQLYVNEKIFFIMQTYGRLCIDLRLHNKIVTIAVKRRHYLVCALVYENIDKRVREREIASEVSKQLLAFVFLSLSEQMHALRNYSGERAEGLFRSRIESTVTFDAVAIASKINCATVALRLNDSLLRNYT